MKAKGTDDATASTGGNSGEVELTQDTLFHLLENQRRRWVIRYLKQSDGRVSLSELAKLVAAWEHEVPFDQVTAKQRKRTYTSLQQRHLPSLDEAGVIDYDGERGVVEVTDQMRKLDVYLEVVPERDIPWSKYYLGLGLASCALVAGIAATESPFQSIPDLGWAAAIGLTFTASAAVHTYRSYKVRADNVPPEVQRR